MLTPSFLRSFEVVLGQKLGKKIHVRRVTPLSGGSINLAAKLDTTGGIFFLKANDAMKYPGMFEKEASGLKALSSTNAIAIPQVIMTGETQDQSFLVLEFIDGRARQNDFWQNFGTSLAQLHKYFGNHFGFEEDNFIGSLRQSNKQHATWINFFIEERLERQLKLAMSGGLMNSDDQKSFSQLYRRLEDLIPVEAPSLIHGDLWSGNFITGKDGRACLIDPAVYYGHREMDLAMSRLFGGFDPEFYEAYQQEHPVEAGFEDRVDIHNLYPLMVHVNLFGGGYVGQVRAILKRFR